MGEKKTSPVSVAIIMDGNGRWAKKRALPRTYGHKVGTERIRSTFEYCIDHGIKYLTLYAFSTENWKRPQEEVDAIMGLICEYLDKETDEMNSNGIHLNFIGDLSRIPEKSMKAIDRSVTKLEKNDRLFVNIALNYGGRDEIVNAAKKIAMMVKDNQIDVEDIDEKMISDNLYTSGQPDPDLIIRTGGDIRISNFLIYQNAYSELYFTDCFWPDFDDSEFDKAIDNYLGKDRRFGGLNS